MAFMPMEVKPFRLDKAKNYLKEGFKAEGLSTNNKALNILVQSVDGIPAWLSYIGQRCVFEARERHVKTVNENIASTAVEKMYEDPILTSEIEKDLLKLQRTVKSPRFWKPRSHGETRSDKPFAYRSITVGTRRQTRFRTQSPPNLPKKTAGLRIRPEKRSRRIPNSRLHSQLVS
jgi:hypothetical protein